MVHLCLATKDLEQTLLGRTDIHNADPKLLAMFVMIRLSNLQIFLGIVFRPAA